MGTFVQVDRERSEERSRGEEASDAESQWRHLVKSMEAWNRIVMNLVRLCVCGRGGGCCAFNPQLADELDGLTD